MVRTCCVVGCNVRSHDREGKKLENGLSFHCFPSWRQREGSHVSDITKRQAWIAAVRRMDRSDITYWYRSDTDVNFWIGYRRKIKKCNPIH
uniref:THAP-type domain-containing protein n=1 Tax=Pundamilia nyererei TaxID=303518 RepID=A0A3B4FSG4_9CICH